MIIAGAGGAAHLPGMAASKTPLPVLGVPVESKALHGDGLAALDRADARRRPGRHAGDRSRGRRQRRAPRGRIVGRKPPASASGCALPARQTQAVLDHPDPGLARMSGRRPRRRPARPHARPGRLSAGVRLPLPRPCARAPVADVGQLLVGRTTTARRSASPAGLDVVTYEFENVPVDRGANSSEPSRLPPRWRQRRTGWRRRRCSRAASRACSPRSTFGDCRRRARRAAGAAQDAPPRLRRQGPAILRVQRRRGVRGSGRPLIARRVRPFRASCRCSPSAAATASRRSTRSSRTTTGTASCGSRSRRPWRTRRAAPAEPTRRGCSRSWTTSACSRSSSSRSATALLANEMAPRVHNSGHWTIEGRGRASSRTTCARSSAGRSGSAAPEPVGDGEPDRRPALARRRCSRCRARTCTSTARSGSSPARLARTRGGLVGAAFSAQLEVERRTRRRTPRAES